MGQEIYMNSVLAFQLCCDHKTALQNKVYLKKKKKTQEAAGRGSHSSNLEQLENQNNINRL